MGMLHTSLKAYVNDFFSACYEVGLEMLESTIGYVGGIRGAKQAHRIDKCSIVKENVK